jgi:hypothetical protein
MQANGMPLDDGAFKEFIATQVLTVLRQLAKRGAIVKSGTSRDAKWALMPTPALDKLIVDNRLE